MSDAHPTMRGLTILELLIVLAILIAIGAMVAPALVGVVEERALDASVDVAREQLMLARAHAQRSGRPVEVVYRPDPARIVARHFDGGERGIRDGDRRAAALRGEEDVFAGSDVRQGVDDEDDDALTWGWARRTLPRGVMIGRNPPQPALGAERAALRTPLPESRALSRPIRIAVFMPDGSALLATPVWFANGNGRAVRMEVNVWTGLPRASEHVESERSREDVSGNGGFNR